MDIGYNPIRFSDFGKIQALESEEILLVAQTGAGLYFGDGRIRGIYIVRDDHDVASKLYVDTAIRNAIAEAFGTSDSYTKSRRRVTVGGKFVIFSYS